MIDVDVQLRGAHADLQGSCCRLTFALTRDEVEGGHVKWDLGMPYHIRQNASSSCTHQTAAGGCGVYANRPVICRRYSCAGDTRIWKDFDAMVLNDEWIAEHLSGGTVPRLVAATMIPQAALVAREEPEPSPGREISPQSTPSLDRHYRSST
ncbi:MAG TPA: hypothetical protein VNA69_09825 [Thermoanaerobaculia bacterium]|nr:hypothetical protein [Thermoanaerobaculia bacterium]